MSSKDKFFFHLFSTPLRIDVDSKDGMCSSDFASTFPLRLLVKTDTKLFYLARIEKHDSRINAVKICVSGETRLSCWDLIFSVLVLSRESEFTQRAHVL